MIDSGFMWISASLTIFHLIKIIFLCLNVTELLKNGLSKMTMFSYEDVLKMKCNFIENLKQCLYLKCSHLKMGSHGNALAVSFFRRRARLRSRAHDFNHSIEKRCCKLGRYVSFIEINVLYFKQFTKFTDLHGQLLGILVSNF